MGEIRKGERVEVRSFERGFLGSWYEGVVLRKSNKSCVVRYKTLVGENSGDPLEERVEFPRIRPVPPAVAIDRFSQGDAIEAYDRDGWWVGVVTKVLEENSYAVYFRESEEEQVYPISNLRLRQDWHDGIWIRVYERKNPCLEAYRKRDQSNAGTRIQIRAFAGLKRRLRPDREEQDNEQVSRDSQSEEREDESHDNDMHVFNDGFDSDNDNDNTLAANNNNGARNNKKLPSKSPSDGVDDEPMFATRTNGHAKGTGRSLAGNGDAFRLDSPDGSGSPVAAPNRRRGTRHPESFRHNSPDRSRSPAPGPQRKRGIRHPNSFAANGERFRHDSPQVSTGTRHESPSSNSGSGRKRKETPPVEQETTRPEKQKVECRLRKLQTAAYSYVLQALKSKANGITWKQEVLITDLRRELDIDNDIHIKQLGAIASLELQCNCSLCE